MKVPTCKRKGSSLNEANAHENEGKDGLGQHVGERDRDEWGVTGVESERRRWSRHPKQKGDSDKVECVGVEAWLTQQTWLT